MAKAGFGGVEVAYVYPLAEATTEFLSEPFLADLRFAADRARELGLRFDLTLGSGWSFGGPHITGDLAARRLHWERREIHPGSLDVPVASPWPGDELVGCLPRCRLAARSLPMSYEQLPLVDGMIKIPDGQRHPDGAAGVRARTGQNVKRAAVGSEGPVLDHYSAAAVEAHLRWVGDRLLDAVPAELVGSVFCDSLEVYGADWTPGLADEFARRRGYPLIPVLYLLAVAGPGRRTGPRGLPPHAGRALRGELRRRCAAVGRRSRRVVPDPELRHAAGDAQQLPVRRPVRGRGVGLEGDDTQTRWASSAGHLYGRDVVSAEVWTWVHSPVLPSDAARPQGRGPRAPAERNQPAHRARLAVLANRCAGPGLVLLRRRSDRRPQPLVAGDAGAQRLPEPTVLAAPAG